MNTFLPYPSFKKSAEVLDTKRLGKQRVEVLQLVKCITEEKKGWANHPATVMWRPYLDALIHYGMTCAKVWQKRGYKDTVWLSLYMYLESPLDQGVMYPPWFGSRRFHASHRSNLLRKDSKHYKQFEWLERDNLSYFWPKPDYSWRDSKASDSQDYYYFG
jgi:hypothetical protein